MYTCNPSYSNFLNAGYNKVMSNIDLFSNTGLAFGEIANIFFRED
jgi:hypothetical protein